MAKVLCFDIDDTLMDKLTNPIHIEEICQIIEEHQKAAGILMFVTDKRLYSRDSLFEANDPFAMLLKKMQEEGVDVKLSNEKDYRIMANGDASGIVTNLLAFCQAKPGIDGRESPISFKRNEQGNLVLTPTDSCLGDVKWEILNTKDIPYDEENPSLKIKIEVNGNSIILDTDLASMKELASGKFIHVITGLVAEGCYPSEISGEFKGKFEIIPGQGCTRAIPMSEILLIDDKIPNLENFEIMGGKILFPDSQYLLGHTFESVEKEYKHFLDNIDAGLVNLDYIDGYLNAMNICITHHVPDKEIRNEWDGEYIKFKEKVDEFKRKYPKFTGSNYIKEESIKNELKGLAQNIFESANRLSDQNKKRARSDYITELSLEGKKYLSRRIADGLLLQGMD